MNEFPPARAAHAASLLLRIGLAFVFLYAGIAAFVEPDVWISYLPGFIQQYGILQAFSAVQILLGLWLLSGKRQRYAASLAALMLAGIIVANFSAMDVVFRDVAIFLSAAALAVMG